MYHERTFTQVDVFGQRAYSGNPVAVLANAADISVDEMQAIARWTNLSETTFLLPPTQPEADYRVRIFTPGGELPFAGHPTLGTAHAWLENGGQPHDPHRIVQECAAGLVTIRRTDASLSFAAPPTRRSGALEKDYLEQLQAALHLTKEQVIAHQWVDNGPGWAVLQVADATQVRALQPDFTATPQAMVGVIGAYPPDAPCAFEMRTFAPAVGVSEDPVCGSMAAAVAQWLLREHLVSGAFRISQGECVGRAGIIQITPDVDEVVWVGGTTRSLFRGIAVA